MNITESLKYVEAHIGFTHGQPEDILTINEMRGLQRDNRNVDYALKGFLVFNGRLACSLAVAILPFASDEESKHAAATILNALKNEVKQALALLLFKESNR